MTALTRQRGTLASQLFGTDPGDGWWRRAACADQDPELFHGLSEAEKAAAVSICHECPVVAPCLAEAYRLGDDNGVRGALTAEQRRSRRLKDSRTIIRTCAWCGRGFATRRARYCKPECREQAAHAEKSRARRKVAA